MLSVIITSLLNAGTNWIKAKSTERQALSKAKASRLLRAAEIDADWESLMASASQSSWKDEVWTVSFILIIFACFIPPFQATIQHGFQVLRTTPDWFQWSVLVSIGASFGVRGFERITQQKFPQKNSNEQKIK